TKLDGSNTVSADAGCEASSDTDSTAASETDSKRGWVFMAKPPGDQKRGRTLPPVRKAAGLRPNRGHDGAAKRRRSRVRRRPAARDPCRAGLAGWMHPRRPAWLAPGR